MMAAQSFEQEVLEFVLDGDAVQELLRVAESDWKLSRYSALETIKRMVVAGQLQIYETHQDTGAHIDVAPENLKLEYVDHRPYTWLLKTPGTIRRLNEIYELQLGIDGPLPTKRDVTSEVGEL